MRPSTSTPARTAGDFPVPSGRDEAWRFTPIRRLRGLPAATPADGAEGRLAIDVTAPEGVVVSRVAPGAPELTFAPADRVAATAFAGFTSGARVQVPPGLVVAEPIVVDVAAQGGVAFGHLAVHLGGGGGAVVVVDQRGSGTAAVNIEVDVADGASLNLVSLQDWDADAVHVGQHAFRLGRDASVRAVELTFGGELVRVTTTAELAGAGGDVALDGLYFADSEQHLEHRLFVDHAAPRARSRVRYKGALYGARARTVWVGDVRIRPEAVGTDSYELNRNLLLSDGARADSVPNLEILTGAVERAGHASATGRLDEESLFYLGSRGIPPVEARRLVVRAFFADVIEGITVPEVASRVSDAVEAELAGALG